MKLKLSNGMTYGIDNQGNRVCTGSGMGRTNLLPFQFMGTNAVPIKLQMERLKWVDYDYDSAGCYWGRSNNDHIYCAWKDNVQVFVRTINRAAAKKAVRDLLSAATFYR